VTGVLVAVVATGLICAGFYWQRLLRSWHVGSPLLLWLSLLFLMLAVALQISPFYDSFVDLDGWNLFWPLQWALVMACCLMLHIFAIRVTAPTPAPGRNPVRRRTIVATTTMSAAFVVALALFLTAPDDPDFHLGPGSRLAVPGHVAVTVGLAWVVVQVAIGSSCVSHAVRSFRWANRYAQDNHTWLRPGMRVFAAGFAVGSVYCGHSAAYQAAETIGWIPSWPQETVTDPLITAAPVLMFIGMIMPAIGSWRSERTDGADLLRQLEPLRQLLLVAAPRPKPSLPRRVRRSWLRQWWPMLQVYESMIDIEDTYLQIRHQLPPAVAEHATEAAREAGLDQTGSDLVVLATSIVTWATAVASHATDQGIAAIGERTVRGLLRHGTADLHRSPGPKPRAGGARNVALTLELERWLSVATMLGSAMPQLRVPAFPSVGTVAL
jgi:hypothetical protein